MTVVAARPYVELKDQGYWILGTRIALDSVVYAFRRGQSPERIIQSYPLLSLEQVYGTIAFYLANRLTIDIYLEQEEDAFDQMVQPIQSDEPDLYQKLMAAKEEKPKA